MTLEQLRIFAAVAETLHVTKAAQALHLTQPAASAAIAALEEEFATPLFHRIGRRIELTEAGKLFRDEAKAVLQRAREAETALAELAGLQQGALALHASLTVAAYWLPPRLYRFREQHPGIALKIAIANTAEVAQAVLSGAADLGFIEGDVEDERLRRQTVAEDELVLVVGAFHPWAQRVEIAPEELHETRWVLRESGSGTRSEFEAALRRFKIEPGRLSIALELPSNEAVCNAVEAGAGATVVSRLVAANGLRSGALRTVDLPLPKRRFEVLRHAERFQSKAAAAFLALLDGES